MYFINIEFFGYFAAVLTTAAFLPQLIKTLKTKKAEDVSLLTLVMFICGVVSWIPTVHGSRYAASLPSTGLSCGSLHRKFPSPEEEI